MEFYSYEWNPKLQILQNEIRLFTRKTDYLRKDILNLQTEIDEKNKQIHSTSEIGTSSDPKTSSTPLDHQSAKNKLPIYVPCTILRKSTKENNATNGKRFINENHGQSGVKRKRSPNAILAEITNNEDEGFLSSGSSGEFSRLSNGKRFQNGVEMYDPANPSMDMGRGNAKTTCVPVLSPLSVDSNQSRTSSSSGSPILSSSPASSMESNWMPAYSTYRSSPPAVNLNGYSSTGQIDPCYINHAKRFQQQDYSQQQQYSQYPQYPQHQNYQQYPNQQQYQRDPRLQQRQQYPQIHQDKRLKQEPLKQEPLKQEPLKQEPTSTKCLPQKEDKMDTKPPSLEALLQGLVKNGTINKAEPTKNQLQSLSDPKFLGARNVSAIEALYTGTQCSNCCVRFPVNETAKYNEHLDYHFRQNRREKEALRKVCRRQWYYSVANWKKYQEIEHNEEREKNWFEKQQMEKDSVALSKDATDANEQVEATCVAGDDKACCVCSDPFEIFFDDEEEEWLLRNATRVDGMVYHPKCLRESTE